MSDPLPVSTDPTPDLGDGLTPFRANGQLFHVDLFDWAAWTSTWTAPPDAGPFAHLDAVRQRLREQCGVILNYRQADEFLAAIAEQIATIKKKQRDALSSLNSSESTLFS
jgi:hypothetical protein